MTIEIDPTVAPEPEPTPEPAPAPTVAYITEERFERLAKHTRDLTELIAKLSATIKTNDETRGKQVDELAGAVNEMGTAVTKLYHLLASRVVADAMRATADAPAASTKTVLARHLAELMVATNTVELLQMFHAFLAPPDGVTPTLDVELLMRSAERVAGAMIKTHTSLAATVDSMMGEMAPEAPK